MLNKITSVEQCLKILSQRNTERQIILRDTYAEIASLSYSVCMQTQNSSVPILHKPVCSCNPALLFLFMMSETDALLLFMISGIDTFPPIHDVRDQCPLLFMMSENDAPSAIHDFRDQRLSSFLALVFLM